VRGREIACAHAGRGKLIASGIWLRHESRLSSELELFANSKLSWDSSVRREDRVTGIPRPTATICSNMWLWRRASRSVTHPAARTHRTPTRRPRGRIVFAAKMPVSPLMPAKTGIQSLLPG